VKTLAEHGLRTTILRRYRNFRALKTYGKESFHLAHRRTTGPKPLPKPVLHIVRSIASSFKWEYPLLSLRSSSSFLCLHYRPPVTPIPSFIFPSITCCRRQFLRKMWPIQLAFRLLNSCRIFSAPWLYAILLHFSHDRSNWSSSFSSTTFQNFPGVSDLLPEQGGGGDLGGTVAKVLC